MISVTQKLSSRTTKPSLMRREDARVARVARIDGRPGEMGLGDVVPLAEDPGDLPVSSRVGS